jgi:hypothetical protein
MIGMKVRILIGTGLSLMAYAILGAFSALSSPIPPSSFIVGVNAINPQWLSNEQQDAELDAIQKYGVRVVRIPLLASYNQTTQFIVEANRRRISVLLNIYPSVANSSASHSTFPGARPRLLVNGKTFIYSTPGLSHANPRRFVATGFDTYIKMLAALKTVRDHSRFNRTTPIIAAGFADVQQGDLPPGLDAVSFPAALDYLRALGLDKLVDYYSIHTYPSAQLNAGQLMDYLSQKAFKSCGNSKPCWVTEWGFPPDNKTCGAEDAHQLRSVTYMRQDFNILAQEGKLGGSFYFSWNDPDHGVYRCDALSAAGLEALTPASFIRKR